MSDPKVRFKRSSVPGKIPNETQVPLGEIALNTYDGKVFASKNVGIGTTVFTVNPWNVGTGTDVYDINFTVGNVGIGSTLPTSKLDVTGNVKVSGIVTATSFFGSGSNLTGIVTSITAGSGISIDQSTGNVTITSTGGAGAGISAIGSADNYIITLTPSFNGITTAFTMQYNSNNYSPLNEQQLLVSLGGVIQEPTIAYTVSSSTITFASAPNTETDYFITALNTAPLSRNAQSYNVTGVQTNFTLTNGYTIGYVDVYLNGARLVSGDDYTATNGTTVGLTSAAQNGDVVEVVGYKSVSLSTDDLTIIGNLNVLGITTLGGVVKVGVGSTALIVNGDARVTGILTVGSSSVTIDGINNRINVGTGLTLSNGIVATGVITATSFVGDGSGLTGAGSTVVDDTSTNQTLYPVLTAQTSGTITASKVSTTKLSFNPSTGVVSGTGFSGSGASLTSLNADNVSSGTLTNSRLPSNINVSGVVTATSFSGSGANLTSLNASQLTSGIVPSARITETSPLTVNGDLYVAGNISFGGTTTQLNTSQVTFSDPDIVLGVGTTSTFNPTDDTANHGGIAIASTEGYPLVNLNINPNEILPTTYKKFMWFKNNAAGLGTDAWLSNFAVGIGSTQFPDGTRLVAGNVQFGSDDLNVVRNISASGVVTATSFIGNLTGNVTGNLNSSGVSTFSNGPVLVGSGTSTGTASQTLQVTGGTYVSGNIGVGLTNPSTKLDVIGSIQARAAATQDGVLIAGRTGGTSSYDVTITPTTLTNDRTLTLADGNTTLQAGTMAITGGTLGQFAATTSSQLAGVISDETGSGSLVFANTPTLVTPNIGAATGTSLSVSGQLTSTVATGTAPLTVSSTTVVTNLNADLLDGVQGASYLRSDASATNSVDLRAPIFYQSDDTNSYWNGNELTLRGNNPTLTLRDTDHNTGYIHCNSNVLYVLRGANDAAYGSWAQVSGQWPWIWNLTNNDSTCGGSLAAVGNVTAYSSDRRLKENFKHIETPLEKIQKLNGYTFDWKEQVKELGFTPSLQKNDIGLIAQEVQEVLPQAVVPAPFDQEWNGEKSVSKSGEDYLTVQYERLVPLLVEAIKEQQEQIKEQQEQINTLKEEINNLKK